MLCPICGKRKANRFCPAKGEKICAVCCGTEREVTIDCPVDCPFLIAAHRYEYQHPREIPAGTPMLDVRVPQDLLYTQQQLMAALAFTLARFCTSRPEATDPDILSALQALAETQKTLTTGIYYETRPAGLVSRELYVAVSAFLAEGKEKIRQAGHPIPKELDLFHLLVFLYRMGLVRTNGRPRSRRFIEFLRSQFSQSPDTKREQSRIIVP